MNLVKDSILTYATSVLGLVVIAAGGILVARTLGPEGKGLVTILLLVPTMLIALGDLGIRQSSIYALSGLNHSLDRVLATVLLASVVLGGALVGVGALLLALLGDSFLRGIPPDLFYISISSVPAWLLLKYITQVFRGLHRPVAYNVVAFLEQAFYLLFLVALFLVVEISVQSAVWARLTSVLAALGLALLLLPRGASAKLRFRLDLRVARDMVTYGAKVALVLSLGFLNRRVALFMANGQLSAAEVGFYAVALSLAELIWLFPDSVGIVLFPKLCKSSEREARSLTPQVARYTFFFTTLMALGLLVISRPFISLVYGESFVPSFLPLIILLPGMVVLSIHKILWRDFMSQGKPLYSLVSRAVTLLVLVGLGVVLSGPLGLAGLALASTTSYFIGTVILVLIYSHLFNVPLHRFALNRIDMVQLSSTLRVIAADAFRFLNLRSSRPSRHHTATREG